MTKALHHTTEILMTCAAIILIIPTASLPPPGQRSWAAHNRALRNGTATDATAFAADATRETGTLPPLSVMTTPSPATPAPSPRPEKAAGPLSPVSDVAKLPPLSIPTPSSSEADALLDRLLSALRGPKETPPPSLTQRLLPEYRRAVQRAGGLAALKERFAARFAEAEDSLRRMEQLGVLLLRLHHLAGEGGGGRPHHQHHHRRRPGAGAQLKRVGWWWRDEADA